MIIIIYYHFVVVVVVVVVVVAVVRILKSVASPLVCVTAMWPWICDNRYAFIGLTGSKEELQLTASNLWALPSQEIEKELNGGMDRAVSVEGQK